VIALVSTVFLKEVPLTRTASGRGFDAPPVEVEEEEQEAVAR